MIIAVIPPALEEEEDELDGVKRTSVSTTLNQNVKNALPIRPMWTRITCVKFALLIIHQQQFVMALAVT